MSSKNSRQVKVPSGVKISIESHDHNNCYLHIAGSERKSYVTIPEGLKLWKNLKKKAFR